jgi:hypothetical protein
MRNKIWGIIKDKIHVDGTFNPLGLTYFKTSNAEQVDELTDAILQAIRDEVEGVKTLTAHTSGSFATGWQAGFNYCRSQIEEKLK